MADWMTGETRALLGLWGAADEQAQLNVAKYFPTHSRSVKHLQPV